MLFSLNCGVWIISNSVATEFYWIAFESSIESYWIATVSFLEKIR